MARNSILTSYLLKHTLWGMPSPQTSIYQEKRGCSVLKQRCGWFLFSSPGSVLTRSPLKPVSLNAARTTSSWEGRRSFLGLPLQLVAGGAPGWFRGAGAAALLPGVVGAGQSRASRRCHLALPTPIPASRAVLPWRELRLTGNTIFHMVFWTNTLLISPRKWRSQKCLSKSACQLANF